jgi:hypothetical protein
MAYFVKVIPPSKRARIHSRECRHCRDGRGQEGQDSGYGPTYWQPAYPQAGYETLEEAHQVMADLDFHDVGICADCERQGRI